MADSRLALITEVPEEMIELSVKGLADYIMGSPAAQHTTLRDFKYRDEDEAMNRRLYYHDAREVVRGYHREGRHADWLLDKANALRLSASNQSARAKTRHDHNARALEQYHQHFAHKKFDYQRPLRLNVTFGRVRIKVSPDLYVIERNRLRIIRVEFSTSTPSQDRPRLFNIIGQLMFEAAAQKSLAMTSADVLCYDVTTGQIHRGRRVGSRMQADIVAACTTIAAVWPTIKP